MVAQECATSRVYNHGTLSGRLRLYLLRHLYAHACFRACLFSSTANVVCAIRPSAASLVPPTNLLAIHAQN